MARKREPGSGTSDSAANANTSETGVSYFTSPSFDAALKKALLGGGDGQRAATKAKAILGGFGFDDPFHGVPVTNHGESRIKHCFKYNLGDGWRLVTQQTNKTCLLLFFGDHDETDIWLERKKGQQFGVEGNRAVLIPGRADHVEKRDIHRADHHDQPLVERLDDERIDFILEGISRSLARQLEKIDAGSGTDALQEISDQIDDPSKADLVLAVFSLLMSGDIDGAANRVDLERGLISDIDEVDETRLINIQNGKNIRRIEIGSKDYEDWLRSFESQSPWHEWFLFLHPEQDAVVEADYPGVSQLSGVSGSGKTCVAVRRALRLAAAPDAKVLVLTLNRSLAGLLAQLVEAACVDTSVRSRVEVTSYFELAQRLLRRFEPENEKLYEDISWKLEEHVDEVFREYYRQWLNNKDASVLSSLHKSLNAREVNGEVYLKEEFDWIRSAVSDSDRLRYLKLERKGRRFPIPNDRRKDILAGLAGWEQKMRNVGVIDYLGLSSALSNYGGKIEPEYSHIIVDEAQDFGTTELSVVRKLVPVQQNDIFLCGDVAQTILPKHRSLEDAEIKGVTRAKIYQNYRNSREILKAAYEVLKNNLHEEMLDSDDFEILDPKYANFSGSVPMALAANSLEEEIAYARKYADHRLSGDAKTVCIAFAGFSSRDIQSFAKACGVDALEGSFDPSIKQLVFCDLEQTKGYEFDTLIIIQCRDGILPPHDAPTEEVHRASCKLYVAMTRAKRELILSFHGAASPWIRDVSDSIGTEFWSEVEELDSSLLMGVPEQLPEMEPNTELLNLGELNGVQFLYTPQSLGLSLEAQEKIAELVDGRGRTDAQTRRRTKWRNMQSFISDISADRRFDNLIGSVTSKDIIKHISKHLNT